jgi:hypothetical protein
VPQIACWVIVLGLTLARVLKNLIYDVSPADPLTFYGGWIDCGCDRGAGLLRPGKKGYAGRSDDCFAG